MLECYARDGTAVAYIGKTGKEIFLFEAGRCVAWLWGNHIFTFGGDHVGFWAEGWVRDPDGNAVLYTKDARGGPAAPELQPLPRKSAEGMPPTRPARGPIPAKPDWSDAWSPLSGTRYFSLFLDEHGTPLPRGSAAARLSAARAKAAQEAPAEPTPNREPVAVEPSSSSPAPRAASAGGDAVLAELNEAVRAWRAHLADGGTTPLDQAVAGMLRLRLHASVESWALERGKALREDG